MKVLYGLPVAPSYIPRLAAVSRVLGKGSVGLFVDNLEHIQRISQLDESIWPGRIPIMVKIAAETPFRAGLSPESESLNVMAKSIANSPKVELKGAYAHMGHSYAASSPAEALAYLIQEMKAVQAGAARLATAKSPGADKLVISLGATPTITSAQNVLEETEWNRNFRAYLDQVKETYDLEFHAGVYPVLDMQQLATRARPSVSGEDRALLSPENLALRIMVEVASVYDERDKPEALVSAGSIVLAREPCKNYPGWGVVSAWSQKGPSSNAPVYDPEGSRNGWIVGQISQEHGTLTWEGTCEDMRKLEIGEKLMIWPNHACMAGPNFGWYLVVDSDTAEKDMVGDIWTRCRGW